MYYSKYPYVDTKNMNMKYSRVILGQNAGKEIENSMAKAEKFIYIISPYFDLKSITKLYELNRKLDIKLIFSDSANFIKSNGKKLRGLLEYEEKQDIDKKRAELYEKHVKKIKKISYLEKIFGLIFLVMLGIVAGIYYKKIFSFNYLIESIVGAVIFFISFFTIEYMKKKEKEDIKEKFEKAKKEIVPNMKWNSKINIKILKSLYGDKELKTPFSHIKLYLIDSPELSKTSERDITQVFMGSANFTCKGFVDNLECIFGTTDLNVTEQIHDFFIQMYSCIDFKYYSLEEIVKAMFENGDLPHREDK